MPRVIVKKPILTGPQTVFTIHRDPNSILAVTPKSNRTAAISFQTYKSAHHFGRLLEAYKMNQKEWPDLSGNTINLMDDGRKELKMLDIMEWDIENLKHECALRYLNLIVADNSDGSLKGIYISLHMDEAVIKHHLDFLWNITE